MYWDKSSFLYCKLRVLLLLDMIEFMNEVTSLLCMRLPTMFQPIARQLLNLRRLRRSAQQNIADFRSLCEAAATFDRH